MYTNNAVAVILGSAFDEGLHGVDLVPEVVATPWGDYTLYRVEGVERPAYVSFRHGRPHRLLPSQIDYRAQAYALHAAGVRALMVTSSVGVLNPELPLYRLLLVEDLLMLGNRLPDGSACTMFTTPSSAHGHLVLSEGLFSKALTEQANVLALDEGVPPAAEVVFMYVGGPRTKTPAENRLAARLGAEVNSMTLGPEVVLANELGIPCAGVVVGHKHSNPDAPTLGDEASVADSLIASRAALERVVVAFLGRGYVVPFGNHLYQYGGDQGG